MPCLDLRLHFHGIVDIVSEPDSMKRALEVFMQRGGRAQIGVCAVFGVSWLGDAAEKSKRISYMLRMGTVTAATAEI
jgi:hypothetical protein